MSGSSTVSDHATETYHMLAWKDFMNTTKTARLQRMLRDLNIAMAGCAVHMGHKGSAQDLANLLYVKYDENAIALHAEMIKMDFLPDWMRDERIFTCADVAYKNRLISDNASNMKLWHRWLTIKREITNRDNPVLKKWLSQNPAVPSGTQLDDTYKTITGLLLAAEAMQSDVPAAGAGGSVAKTSSTPNINDDSADGGGEAQEEEIEMSIEPEDSVSDVASVCSYNGDSAPSSSSSSSSSSSAVPFSSPPSLGAGKKKKIGKEWGIPKFALVITRIGVLAGNHCQEPLAFPSSEKAPSGDLSRKFIRQKAKEAALSAGEAAGKSGSNNPHTKASAMNAVTVELKNANRNDRRANALLADAQEKRDAKELYDMAQKDYENGPSSCSEDEDGEKRKQKEKELKDKRNERKRKYQALLTRRPPQEEEEGGEGGE